MQIEFKIFLKVQICLYMRLWVDFASKVRILLMTGSWRNFKSSILELLMSLYSVRLAIWPRISNFQAFLICNSWIKIAARLRYSILRIRSVAIGWISKLIGFSLINGRTLFKISGRSNSSNSASGFDLYFSKMSMVSEAVIPSKILTTG